ncbi:hypothetical protein [Catellatospora paridis]|uniref:hypothetical protein n=1 Tax=Catellatospora paridis TaxID=1617086 RepID=UPI0012D49871|nr:hypothetical protein [Catellatospora paridis]
MPFNGTAASRTTDPRTEPGPRYPMLLVRIPPGPVDDERLIGRITHQLRAHAGASAAAEFARTALACRTPDDVLALARATVTVLTSTHQGRQHI